MKVNTEEDKEDLLDAAIRRTKDITFCACRRINGSTETLQKVPRLRSRYGLVKKVESHNK